MTRLDLVVGPNGAGKSTFVRLSLAPARLGVPFVNADLIADRLWPGDTARHAYAAADTAARTRAMLIARGMPFIAETVFSHPSKLELVAEAATSGFEVVLHVVMVPVELSVRRVAYRVRAGGHPVPEDKIRERHDRLFALVARAALAADHATFWANHTSAGPQRVAALRGGVPTGDWSWPSWRHPDLVEVLRREG